MLHEPFTLFTFRWNGRFLHLHQNIYNNHCNTATKAYHTMNQRAMVADHLQRAMVICHTTVTDVADGFQRICHRNALIFMCIEFRCRYVCDFGWQDKVTVLHVLSNFQMRQGRLFNAPRRIHEFVKEFSSKHQGLFQKDEELFEKVLDVLMKTLWRIHECALARWRISLDAFGSSSRHVKTVSLSCHPKSHTHLQRKSRRLKISMFLLQMR